LYDHRGHDAPLTARDLKRLAARAVFGLARTGSSYSHGSGDYAIAFSTADSVRVKPGTQPRAAYQVLPPDRISPLFEMVLEATEEAVYNSLLQATTISSRFGKVEAIPTEALQRILQEYGVSKRER
jgi:D-aminopeptidase